MIGFSKIQINQEIWYDIFQSHCEADVWRRSDGTQWRVEKDLHWKRCDTQMKWASCVCGTSSHKFRARGPTRAETELGWIRGGIRKGLHELESGIRCVDNFAARGRKRPEYYLPNLLADIQSIVDGQS